MGTPTIAREYKWYVPNAHPIGLLTIGVSVTQGWSKIGKD